MSLADLRTDYRLASLSEADVNRDPILQFRTWFDEAQRAEVPEPNAMCLATAMRDGMPSARIVLLKDIEDNGFVFYTDYRSQKGRELAENPHGALCFFWQPLERQVRITGSVERVSREQSAAYFASRPVGSRISASTSVQSSVISGREVLEARAQELLSKTVNDVVPLPDYWGGFRLVPQAIEFWQGRSNRLHDRIRYDRMGDHWSTTRLSP